ncbi:perilipin-3-like isoform X2 [Varroa jacobsoni]|uniref:perilipin-3-like isoform X2 n=1 Tax=Varroa jacobsoni TaxID=62625 RepID=UPI000BF62225|nr:perilipin-3-like isoform X2 [Varroa jacobsoni]
MPARSILYFENMSANEDATGPRNGKLPASAATDNNSDMVAETNRAQSVFVTRVSALPTVEAALGMAVSSYNKLKEVSPGPIKNVIEVSEKTTQIALASSQPIITKLQGPIQFVDSLACQGLDRVEQTVPAVKEAPEKILSDVRVFGTNKVTAVRNSVVDYSNQKLQQLGLGAMAPERFGEYCEQLVGYATVALATAEGMLDSHLIARGAVVPKFEDNVNLRDRMEHLTTKARLAVTHHTTGRFLAAQKAASDGVSRVLEALSVIYALKDNVQEGKSVQEFAHILHFDWLASLLEEAKEKPAAQQALFIAQAAARQAQDSLSKAHEGVKGKLTSTYAAVLNRASELSSTLQSTSVNQLSSQVMSTLTEKAQQLQDLIRQLTGLNLKQYLPELKANQASGDGSSQSGSGGS